MEDKLPINLNLNPQGSYLTQTETFSKRPAGTPCYPTGMLKNVWSSHLCTLARDSNSNVRVCFYSHWFRKSKCCRATECVIICMIMCGLENMRYNMTCTCTDWLTARWLTKCSHSSNRLMIFYLRVLLVVFVFYFYILNTINNWLHGVKQSRHSGHGDETNKIHVCA